MVELFPEQPLFFRGRMIVAGIPATTASGGTSFIPEEMMEPLFIGERDLPGFWEVVTVQSHPGEKLFIDREESDHSEDGKRPGTVGTLIHDLINGIELTGDGIAGLRHTHHSSMDHIKPHRWLEKIIGRPDCAIKNRDLSRERAVR